MAHLGIEFVEVTPDRVLARLKVADKLTTVGGSLHPGTLMAFPATIPPAPTLHNRPGGQRPARLEPKPTFTAGCRSGTVQAEAKPIHKGKRTHVWETRITDESGKLLSVTTQTQMIL